MCADKNKGNTFAGLMRRVLTDAQQRFDAADLNHLHHLGFIDVTKYGRLSAVVLQEICTWCHQLLSQNPEFSSLDDNCFGVVFCITEIESSSE